MAVSDRVLVYHWWPTRLLNWLFRLPDTDLIIGTCDKPGQPISIMFGSRVGGKVRFIWGQTSSASDARKAAEMIISLCDQLEAWPKK